VALAGERRRADTLSMLKRIRTWQHRQSRYGKENHDWHDAELFLASRSGSGTRWTRDPNVRWITLDATDQPASTGNIGEGP
jgi:hypothetical protein